MRMATFSTAAPLSYPSECSLPASPRPVCLQYPLPFHSLPGHIHDTRFVDLRGQTLLTRNIYLLSSSHISTKLPKHQISVYRTQCLPFSPPFLSTLRTPQRSHCHDTIHAATTPWHPISPPSHILPPLTPRQSPHPLPNSPTSST